MHTARLAIAAAALVVSTNAFYLPGAAPHDYHKGEKVELYVNALTPMYSGTTNAKLKSLINYDYYNPKLHFCEPDGGPKKQPESLGSILFGDRIFNSPYDIKMLEGNGTCKKLCLVEGLATEDAKFINERIREDYALNWLVDGLPAAEMKNDTLTGDVFFDMGFNLGNNDGTQTSPALNNHYDIVLRYHQPSPDTYRIVGVLVWPRSISGDQHGDATCETKGVKPLRLYEDSMQPVRYSYRVIWEKSDTPWATRWDNYLHMFDLKVHWFTLINSLVIVVFLCIMVSTILWRKVSRDISRYNASDIDEGIQEDWGWKLLSGEVFRTPPKALPLSVMVGNGAQLCAMVAVTLVFALLGFLSPSNRGSLATVMMVCWSFFGGIGGYISSRLYSTLGGTERGKNAFLTATILPTFVFMIVFCLNFFLLVAGSSGAVPFGTMLLIVLLWFGISAPLSGFGSYLGSKHGGLRNPVRANQIPRQIPLGPRYLNPWIAALLGGLLPFGAAYVELSNVMSSLFASRAYYAFGFVALTAAVVALTVATVSILFTYFSLCAEEYRWQWRSFLIGGGSAFWVLCYGLGYWASRLSLDSLSGVVLYFGYLFLIVLLDFLVTGSIGFLASYWAVRRLYTSIRID